MLTSPGDEFRFQYGVFKIVYGVPAFDELDEHLHRYATHFESWLEYAGKARLEKVQHIRVGEARYCRMGFFGCQFVVRTEASHAQSVARHKNGIRLLVEVAEIAYRIFDLLLYAPPVVYVAYERTIAGQSHAEGKS